MIKTTEGPLTPTACSTRCNKLLWSTVLNAALRFIAGQAQMYCDEL